MKVHHIGYLVKSIKRSIEKFEKLGYKIETEIISDSVRKIDICFLLNQEMRIELIQSTSKESVVASFAKKIGNSPYHICYETQNINQSIEKLTEDGYVLIHQPEKAIAIRNKKVAFLMSGEIGIIELVEF